MIGQTILHYEILGKLGEGGMGVVYKAADTRLKRNVAIKFLPRQIAASEEERVRFQIEAQAAAALNHPNIATIHSIEEVDDEMFIVMEFIEGRELRGIVGAHRGTPLPIDDVFNYATQIAEGLKAAHAKGVTHRDIKSANIMVTESGQVKIMDFGLAKMAGASVQLTKDHTTLGTAAYMSPEQARGEPVDQRTDIWAFGVVLYEMLTGQLPFRGEYEQAIIYSILTEEPELTDQIPASFHSILQKALAKDANERYQHMDDLVSELKRAQGKTGEVTPAPSYTSVDTQAILGASGAKHPLLRYGGIGIGILVLVTVGWFLFAPSGISINPNMTTRVLEVPFTQYSYPSLSPDGKWIAFPAADASGKWDIYYMHVDGEEPRKITSDATSFIQQSTDISPDGGQIVYTRLSDDRTRYDIFAISALGGTSRKLAEAGAVPEWSPDGERVGFIKTTMSKIRSASGYVEFWTVRADGSDLRREFADSLFDSRGVYRFDFCWSPDGSAIAWLRTDSTNSQLLVVRELETGKERLLTEGNENIDTMAWTADDRIIFSSNRRGNTNLWAISASGGEAVQLTKGGGPDIALSVASSGNELVYLQQQRVGYLWTANIDGSALRQITFDDREIWSASFSPDKERIAFVMNNPDPLTRSSDVYVIDRDGNNRRRLTSGLTDPQNPVWSPDGRRIMYSVVPTGQGDRGRPRVYVVEVDQPGAPTLTGYNFGFCWLDNDHILALDGVRSYIVTVSKATTRRFFADSLSVWFLAENWIGYYDGRRGREGWWVTYTQPESLDDLLKQTGDVIMPVLKGEAQKVSSSPYFMGIHTSKPSRLGNFLQYAGEDKVRLISFTGHNDEVLAARFPGVRNRSIEMSADGKEIVFVTPRLSSKLILSENIFE